MRVYNNECDFKIRALCKGNEEDIQKVNRFAVFLSSYPHSEIP